MRFQKSGCQTAAGILITVLPRLVALASGDVRARRLRSSIAVAEAKPDRAIRLNRRMENFVMCCCCLVLRKAYGNIKMARP